MGDLLKLDGVHKVFKTSSSTVTACKDINFTIKPGEVLGLVGESGSGKSTIANLILKLEKIDAGRIILDGEVIADSASENLKTFHSKVQGVFQYPLFSVDIRKNIEWIISEPLVIHKFGSKTDISNKVTELLLSVALSPNTRKKYPRQLSGGQLQRVNIARALALNPKLLICDEPVSALDVSIQAQIMNLFQEIQSKLDVAMLFISHDLSVVRYLSDRIAVMYGGSIVEIGETDSICDSPRHPYTRSLIAASKYKSLAKEGEETKNLDQNREIPKKGCPFAPRCIYVKDQCLVAEIKLKSISNGTSSACIRDDI